MNKQRNQTVDILRGLAMLMVVLGHTMTGCTENSQESFLFNVIWSLQMPLFILISGYVTKYSRPIVNCITYVRFVRKKTFAYLLPWLVWTFVVRGLIFGQTSYLDIKFVMFNMDSGYWFLFTLWTIVMVYGLAQFLSGCICKQKNKYRKLITFTVFYLLGMIGLVAVGLVTGLAFLGIKLTLYYMPFYYVGFLFGQFDAKLFEYKYGDRIKDTMVAVSFACWLALMARFNFYSIGDDFRGIILRVLASMMGCIAVCGLVPRLYTSAGGVLRETGIHSLEIYLTHYLILAMIKLSTPPAIQTPEGILLMSLNFIVTMVIATVTIMLINQNKIMKLILFGKRD